MDGFECVLVLKPSTSPALIKRLALFFDRIYCMPPLFSAIQPTTWLEHHGGSWNGELQEPFDYRRDIHRLIAVPLESVEWTDGEMPEVIACLLENGIIEETFEERLGLPEMRLESFRQWQEEAMVSDRYDAKFSRLTGTNPLVGDHESMPVRMLEIRWDKAPDVPSRLPVIPEIPSVEISRDISSSLFIAERLGAFPVYDKSLRPILRYKYHMAQEGAQVIRSLRPEIELDLDERGEFGDIAFSLTNELFQSHVVGNLPIGKLVAYRKRTADARTKFVSLTMGELLGLIDSGPWTNELRKKVNTYVRTKLSVDLVQYNDQTREIWEKMFGQIMINLVEAAEWSTPGIVAAAIIPGVSPLQMFLLALAGAMKAAPALVRDLIPLILQLRAHKRNSLAYLAGLVPKGKSHEKRML